MNASTLAPSLKIDQKNASRWRGSRSQPRPARYRNLAAISSIEAQRRAHMAMIASSSASRAIPIGFLGGSVLCERFLDARECSRPLLF